MQNKDKDISLRKSLGSLRDVALAEIDLIEDEAGKIEFADFVMDKVKVFLGEISERQRPAWLKQNSTQAKKFKAHAKALLSANAPSACPPGFIEVDGICVRI